MSDDEVKCNPHPEAPHGFDRNGSHSAGRYVCDCEGWDPYDAGYEVGYRKGLSDIDEEPISLCLELGRVSNELDEVIELLKDIDVYLLESEFGSALFGRRIKNILQRREP